MFIPLEKKPDWSNPPVVTITLIFITLLCYGVLQYNDRFNEQSAYAYYFSSSLGERELPAYLDYLQHKQAAANAPFDKLDNNARQRLFQRLLGDGEFIAQLNAGEIITPSQADYDSWRQLRSHFEAQLEKSMAYRFGLKNYSADALSLFSYMFLHADIWHLLGNMLFLFVFGFALEMLLGRLLFLAVFMACGLTAALFGIALSPHNAQWVLGASGAISGLAGLYTVFFGLRKIRFFYTLGFYFDYIKAPAIIMLPAWISYELLYQFISPGAVNTDVHLGGLTSGAIIGVLLRKFARKTDAPTQTEATHNNFEIKLQQGRDYLAKMDIEKAKTIFLELLEQKPDNPALLNKLFNIAKLNPATDEIHAYAVRILCLSDVNSATVKMQNETFHEYTAKTDNKIKLSPEQLMNLALRFSSSGYLEDAEKIILFLTRQYREFGRNSEGLLALANQYRKKGAVEKSENYAQLLLQYYADSLEAQTLRQAHSQTQ